MDPFWILLPAERDFGKRGGWEDLGQNRFRAVGLHVLVQPRRALQLLKGPAVSKFEVPAGSEVNLEHEQASVVTYTEAVERQVQETVATKLGGTLAAKTGGELSFKALLPNGKVSAELSATLAAEMSAQLQEQLNTTQSYQVQESQKVKVATKLTLSPGGAQSESVFLYLNVHPLHWDLYLAGVEEVVLEYKHDLRSFFSKVRKIECQDYLRLDEPLCRLTLYQPVEQYSLALGAHQPDINDPYSICVGAVPPGTPPPHYKPPTSLRDLAVRAFPIAHDRHVTTKRAASLKRKAVTTKATRKAVRTTATKTVKRASARKSITQSRA